MTHQNGGIMKFKKNLATARRLRDEMIFWEAMARIHNEAVVASVGSYLLDIIANE